MCSDVGPSGTNVHRTLHTLINIFDIFPALAIFKIGVADSRDSMSTKHGIC